MNAEAQTKSVIELDNLSAPEYLSHYMNLSISMSGVFLLAIENSRYFQRIENISNDLKKANSTKDMFFSIIAHDLKGPFNSIMGFSELLRDNIKSYDNIKIESFVQSISEASSRAYDLLENLLTWARSQTGSLVFNPDYFNLKDCINKSILLTGSQAEKNISLVEFAFLRSLVIFSIC